MDEKAKLFSLINRLTSEEIVALKKIVSSMVSSRENAYPEDELTKDEEMKLNVAMKEIENGNVVRGDNVDGIFK